MEIGDVPAEIRKQVAEESAVAVSASVHGNVGPEAHPTGDGSLAEMEHRHIQSVLDQCNGNKRLAAERLGISRSTLYEKLKSECSDSVQSNCPKSGLSDTESRKSPEKGGGKGL